MAMPLVLPHGNLITPALIKGVVKFKGKGVALRNEFNKIQDFIPETDDRRQQIIVDCLLRVMSRRDWPQPDWEAEFATAP